MAQPHDQVFVVDRDGLQPVEIESPEQWYKSELGPHEAVRYPGMNSFSNERLEFAFAIWNAGEAECCPTAGQVVGTYKIVKHTEAPGLWGMRAPGSNIIVRGNTAPATMWKIDVPFR